MYGGRYSKMSRSSTEGSLLRLSSIEPRHVGAAVTKGVLLSVYSANNMVLRLSVIDSSIQLIAGHPILGNSGNSPGLELEISVG